MEFSRKFLYHPAHSDDIHALEWLSPGKFISGSKDNLVKIWNINEQGNVNEELTFRESGDYSSWITALSVGKASEAFYGTRDGLLGQVVDGEFSEHPLHSRGFKTSICKNRNKTRVTTLYHMANAPDVAVNPVSDLLLIGTPKSILCWNPTTNRLSWKQDLHVNDWIYCILPLERHPGSLNRFRTAVVIGSSFHIYDMDFSADHTSHMNHIHTIWEENRLEVPNGKSRAHIAHIEPLAKTNRNFISSACFDGKVRIFDVERGSLRDALSVHRGRCWQTKELDHSLIVSGADDKMMKLIDLRVKDVVASRHHHGRVSCMMVDPAQSHRVITASCPDDSRSSVKGYISVFDLRMDREEVSVASPDVDIDTLTEAISKSTI